ncbi:MAG: hypothetical protein ABR540_18985 [Acidimicrobiales bacterium]
MADTRLDDRARSPKAGAPGHQGAAAEYAAGRHGRLALGAVLHVWTGSILAWSLIAVAALSGLYAAFLKPAPLPPPVEIPAPTVAAEGRAQAAVVAWLEAGAGDEGRLKQHFSPSLVPSLREVVAQRVGRSAVLDAVAVADGYWSVTVAAEVSADVASAPVQRYYQVAVRQVEAPAAPRGLAVPGSRFAFVATTLPAEIPAPTPAPAPRLAVGSFDRIKSDDPVAVRVARFLSALLAGQGEVADFSTPGATVRAVRPAPYAKVDLRSMATRDLPGADDRLEVLADVVAYDAAGTPRPLSYPLELAQRDGRWEVARVLPAPALSEPQFPTSTSAPSVIPTSSSTSTSTTSTTRPAVTAARPN